MRTIKFDFENVKKDSIITIQSSKIDFFKECVQIFIYEKGSNVPIVYFAELIMLASNQKNKNVFNLTSHCSNFTSKIM